MRAVFIENSCVNLVCKAILVAIGVIFFAKSICYFEEDLKKKSTPLEKNPLVKKITFVQNIFRFLTLKYVGPRVEPYPYPKPNVRNDI